MKHQGQTFALPSGATLHMSRPAFQAAGHLQKTLARAFGAAPLTADEMKATLESLKAAPSTGGGLLQRALMVVASDDVERALFACLETALYQPAGSENRLKVDRALFDHPDYADAARADYYPIMYRAVEVAVKPFLGALASMYTEFRRKVDASRASTPA
jgi:hypothetical protein